MGRTRSSILWAVGTFFALIFIAIVVLVIIERIQTLQEPSHNGIPLTTWLEDFLQGKPGAQFAIRQIGTNAVPTLLELLRQEDSEFKNRLMRIVSYEHLYRFNLKSGLHCQLLGYKGFEALGDLGAFAIPDLLQLVNQPKTSLGAASALVQIGPQGIESLTGALSHEDRDVRRTVATALGAARSASESTVLALIKSLGDGDFTVRSAAATALGQLHTAPNLAVPALVTRINDTNRIVRFAVVQALGRFGTEARAAIEAINSVTNDVDTLVRQAAHSALQQIDDPSTGPSSPVRNECR